MEKLNRVQKCSILGPQNLGSRGGPGPRAPPGSAPDVPPIIVEIREHCTLVDIDIRNKTRLDFNATFHLNITEQKI